MASADEYTVKDAAGRPFTVRKFNGLIWVKAFESSLPIADRVDHLKTMVDFEIKDDDVMVLTFPKTGTHWICEIVAMLMKGKAEYEKTGKENAMLEFMFTKEQIDKLTSPRILNTHFPIQLLPRDTVKKCRKIIHMMRNPKDAIVSFFHHMTTMIPYPGTFQEYFPLICGYGDQAISQSWFDYVLSMEKLCCDHPDLPILNLYYEDMKKDPIGEIRKVASFLEVEYDDTLIKDIAEKCSFDNLKKARSDDKFVVETDRLKKLPGGKSFFYRKGVVGDWKNWFTVAMNEEFDQVYKAKMKNSKLTFQFSLEQC